ncbi:MAG: beta-ketoacyl-ACP synthase II [Spirochaetota bacterium]|jgi:3-oxoacyl-[acyl-carrier-protein] synthase II|nr:beta-ketoacyl-ACP synthase II [Spirochaetota bacterium]
MSNKRRVVLTGMGAITPIGKSFPEFWKNARAGMSGVAPITHFDSTNYATKFAAEVKDFNPDDYFDHKIARRMGRFIQFAYAASIEACRDAGLNLDVCNRERVGILLGSGTGGIDCIEEQKQILIEKGPAKVSPFLVPMATIDMASGQISICMDIRGPNYGVSSACATGNNAIGIGFRSIKYDETDVMFCGGSEASITPLVFAAFSASRALSTRNDNPAIASRPFDRDRDGFVIGEGGAVVILEELGHAQRRGAKIYAEMLGFAATGDAHHLTAPHPEGAGAARAMKLALAEANIEPSMIGHINAHATSTGLGDMAEARALRTVFGEYANKIPVNATKSLVGHLVGGSGALGAACVAKTISCGEVHPSINVYNQDPECDLEIIREAKTLEIQYALANAFGFGGHNTCLVFGKYTG